MYQADFGVYFREIVTILEIIYLGISAVLMFKWASGMVLSTILVRGCKNCPHAMQIGMAARIVIVRRAHRTISRMDTNLGPPSHRDQEKMKGRRVMDD